jgi:hypothetical protein
MARIVVHATPQALTLPSAKRPPIAAAAALRPPCGVGA